MLEQDLFSNFHVDDKNINVANFTFIDLFAGIGGIRIAFESVGGKCVFSSEWDKFAQQTYKVNFGETPYGDITKIDEKDIPHFDVLCAGFPCQPFSMAGLKKGFEDTRGTLFFDIARIINYHKPKIVFLENVKNLLNHDNGNTFETIKKTLENLGYNVYYKILKASDYGLPQLRPRIYIICINNKVYKQHFLFPTPIELNLTMSDILRGECNRKIGFTLRVGGRGSNINDRRNWDSYLVNNKVTKISIDEAKKMMGLSNEFIFPVSERQAMKQIGNSVAINVVKHIAIQIVDLINNNK